MHVGGHHERAIGNSSVLHGWRIIATFCHDMTECERAHAQVKVYEARTRGGPGPAETPPSAGSPVEGPVIEGEFERLGEKARAPHPGKDRDQI